MSSSTQEICQEASQGVEGDYTGEFQVQARWWMAKRKLSK